MSAGAPHANGQGGYAPRPRSNSLALVPLAQSPCAYTHTRIRAYTHTLIHAYVRTRIQSYTHTCLHACSCMQCFLGSHNSDSQDLEPVKGLGRPAAKRGHGPLYGTPKNMLVMGLWPEGPQPLINRFAFRGAARLDLVRITAYFLCNSSRPQRYLCPYYQLSRVAPWRLSQWMLIRMQLRSKKPP